MKENVTLYDLRDGSHPQENGSVFRSRQIFECPACGARTNLVRVNGWGGTRPWEGTRGGTRPWHAAHVACPHAGKTWHDPLADHVSAFGASDSRTVRTKETCRKNAVDDIAGAADYTQVSSVDHIYWYTTGVSFNHLSRVRALKGEKRDWEW